MYKNSNNRWRRFWWITFDFESQKIVLIVVLKFLKVVDNLVDKWWITGG